MLFIGRILASPFYGILKIFEEVYEAVQQEQRQTEQDIMNQLTGLYQLLEAGEISEAEFNRREQLLLVKLDELENI